MEEVTSLNTDGSQHESMDEEIGKSSDRQREDRCNNENYEGKM